MVVHHRHKQRLLGTIVTLMSFILCLDVFFILDRYLSLEMSLLLSFGLGILLLTLYHFYNYEHCHEHVTMINNLTQIYFGVVLMVSIIFILIFRALFNVEIVTSYIIMSMVVIALIFLTLGPYDRFLEEHIGKRFPMHAPEKKRRVVKRAAKKKRK